MTVGTQSLTTLSGATLTVNQLPGGTDVSKWDRFSYQAIFDYTSGTSAGNAILQVSNNNANWTDYTTKAFTAATTSLFFEVTATTAQFARLVTINTSGSGGLVTVILQLVRT